MSRYASAVRRTLLAGLALLVTASLPMPAGAAESDYVLRALEPRLSVETVAGEKFRYLFDTPAKWTTAIAWRYNGGGAPTLFADQGATAAMIAAAGAKWSAVCAVRFDYQGPTSLVPNTRTTSAGHEAPDHANVFGWGPLGASVAGITYSWHGSGNPSPLQDSDVIFAPQYVTSAHELDRVSTHELGHVLGLNHSDVGGAVMSGPPLSAYNNVTALNSDDVRGCRCLYGLPAGTAAGYSCSLPPIIDFGSVGAGAISAPRALTIVNAGNASLQLRDATLDGADFVLEGGCPPGTTLSPGASCTLEVSAKPVASGARSGSLLVSGSDGLYTVPLAAQGVVQPSSSVLGVVEFYNASLQHYFISLDSQEILDLDRQSHPGWVRTGLGFNAFTAATGEASPVCRYYIPPDKGDSHFFSASPSECDDVRQKVLSDPNYSGFIRESDHAFYAALPAATGACAAGTDPVYRLWNQGRTGSNHRYTTSRSVRDQMLAMGYLSEGAGADGVAMCAPH